jgi:hypothetical protein
MKPPLFKFELFRRFYIFNIRAKQLISAKKARFGEIHRGGLFNESLKDYF